MMAKSIEQINREFLDEFAAKKAGIPDGGPRAADSDSVEAMTDQLLQEELLAAMSQCIEDLRKEIDTYVNDSEKQNGQSRPATARRGAAQESGALPAISSDVKKTVKRSRGI